MKTPEPQRPNRTGKTLHCYIDARLREDLTALSAALDVNLTALTETALRLLLHHFGWGPAPDKLWLSLRPAPGGEPPPAAPAPEPPRRPRGRPRKPA